VRDLLTAADKAGYQSKLIELFDRWSPAFVDYYKLSLETTVRSSAEFVTQHMGITVKPYVGITNISESFNRVLKDFRNWKVSTSVLSAFSCLYCSDTKVYC